MTENGERDNPGGPRSTEHPSTLSSSERVSLLAQAPEKQGPSESVHLADDGDLNSGQSEVPKRVESLADGREIIVVGDIEGSKKYNHAQGNNTLGFEGTCGLVSCEDVLNHYGKSVTEDDVVKYAVRRGLCDVKSDPYDSGGTSPTRMSQILNEFGIAANTDSLAPDELANRLERGHLAIAAVNCGRLWDESRYEDGGRLNHAVTVIGFARDSRSGRLEGFFINDSGGGDPNDSGRFIEIDQWVKMSTPRTSKWHTLVVTDSPRPLSW